MAAEAIRVSPEALRQFVRRLRTEVHPQAYAANRVAWMPISEGPPFGANFPSDDVQLLLRKHATCADALTRHIAAFIHKIEALADVGGAIADAYESADQAASVTVDWVESAFVSVETAVTADANPNAGSSRTVID